jgi:hypothetical protein
MYVTRNKLQKAKKTAPHYSIKHTHIKEKENERNNGIVDNILSRQQNMKRRGTEHYVNEDASRNVSKSDVLQRRKKKR